MEKLVNEIKQDQHQVFFNSSSPRFKDDTPKRKLPPGINTMIGPTYQPREDDSIGPGSYDNTRPLNLLSTSRNVTGGITSSFKAPNR